MKYLLVYLAVINAAALLCMLADKRKAVKGRWRISEKTLFLLALAGGSVGVLAGMKWFHHKTRHRLFTIGIPAIIVIQLALLYLYLKARNMI
ncbi:MAG: DUF1294 domain-containing protein [Erysipelotrichaceae bacterium]|nr:DUF1294 domain-containing protein [Erysipelotrichaceae bacterium]MBO4538048.1 DUF1294 domain-containing protein [Erysipelotrichaceae bacterium]